MSRDGEKLHLELYAGDFSNMTELLSSYIQSVWTSGSQSVVVDWRTTAQDLFSIFASLSPGQRSFVNYTDRKVVLSDGLNRKAIAHEIGHVLGFNDNYFEIWDESHCECQHQFREDDIMSNHSSGSVTPEEWGTLTRTYP
ncbi:MAG: hypothetical protein H7301_13605 [Cryobacterium sp.]|nr:hypothetical protein [Oligoflexia bacterium]